MYSAKDSLPKTLRNGFSPSLVKPATATARAVHKPSCLFQRTQGMGGIPWFPLLHLEGSTEKQRETLQLPFQTLVSGICTWGSHVHIQRWICNYLSRLCDYSKPGSLNFGLRKFIQKQGWVHQPAPSSTHPSETQEVSEGQQRENLQDDVIWEFTPNLRVHHIIFPRKVDCLGGEQRTWLGVKWQMGERKPPHGNLLQP